MSANSSAIIERASTESDLHSETRQKNSTEDNFTQLMEALEGRIQILDLYTTEMFTDELLIARRYIAPWKFRRNIKLRQKWELIYQKLLCEEMLVSIQESLNPGDLSSDDDLTSEATDGSSEPDNSTVKVMPLFGSYPVAGQATVYSSRFKKSKSTDRDSGLADIGDNSSFDSNPPSHVSNHELRTSPCYNRSKRKDSSLNYSSTGVSESSDHTSKFQSRQNSFKSTLLGLTTASMLYGAKGHSNGMGRLVKANIKDAKRQSELLKRINEIVAIYQGNETAAERTRKKVLERMMILRMRAEISERCDNIIHSLKLPKLLRLRDPVSKFQTSTN